MARPRRLSRLETAGLIEMFVANPNLSMKFIGDRYGIYPQDASEIISKFFFYKIPSENTEIIVKSSAMNDEIELKQTA